MSYNLDPSLPEATEIITSEEVSWKTTINNKNLSIKAHIKQSSREDVFVEIFHIYYGDTVHNFVGRIINKEGLKKRTTNFDSVYENGIDSELNFLIHEISIRSVLQFKGLCKLYAIRDSEQYTFLFEEYCDIGIVMLQKQEGYERSPESLYLQKYLGLPEISTTLYSEKEASYIMWHVFHTLQELHTNQICHLDINPNNIYLTSSGEVKLGGTHFITSFNNDLFGGLRKNLPGNINFRQPEYWQNGLVSCFSADIWAACVTLYVLVKGTLPIGYESLDHCMERMSHYTEVPDLSGLSAELQDLLSICLSPNMNQRISIQQILMHPWFALNMHCTPNFKKSSPCILQQAIPEKWTASGIQGLDILIDSCYDHFYYYICGDPNYTADVTITPTETTPRDSSTSYQNIPEGSLPKQDMVRFAESDKCWMCWKKTELYVERGKMVIGGIRKPNAIVIPVLTIHQMVPEEKMKNTIKIVLRDNRVFYLKVKSSKDVKEWIDALRLAIRLAL